MGRLAGPRDPRTWARSCWGVAVAEVDGCLRARLARVHPFMFLEGKPMRHDTMMFRRGRRRPVTHPGCGIGIASHTTMASLAGPVRLVKLPLRGV